MPKNFEVEKYWFEDDGVIPNNALPVLVYRQICAVDDKSEWFETTFIANGWTNNWRDTILPYDHFHSTTHEVLGVGKGDVMLHVGGRFGKQLFLNAGDAIILPAGVGHYALPAENEYEIVGGYPEGRAWDLLTGEEGERERALIGIKNVPVPFTDPIDGEHGTLISSWQ